jgi:hypothetical protein
MGATFCVYANDLDPPTITLRLGIQPTSSFKRGTPIATRRRTYGNHPTGGWLVESRDRVASSQLEDHLTWLLSQLNPAAAEVRELVRDGLDVAIICAMSGTPTGGGPTITAATLKDIAALGIPIDFDVYA